MSATVGALLKALEPGWSIEVFERLQDVAQESSHVLNNAGTGHAAFCELNYTPERPDGSVDVSKALTINESFEVSRQFWSYLHRQGHFTTPREFITAVPHISFVRGNQDVAFLRKRCEALCAHPLFEGHAVLGRPPWAGRVDAARDGRPRPGRTRGGHADDARDRRQLRHADARPAPGNDASRRREGAPAARGAGPRPPARWRLAGDGQGPGDGRVAARPRPFRLPGRRRSRPAAAARAPASPRPAATAAFRSAACG